MGPSIRLLSRFVSGAMLVGAGMLAVSAHAAILTFSGVLDASQVVDGGGSPSSATGFGVVTVDTTLFTVTTQLQWAGLSGLADRAHLHDAPEGHSRTEPGNDNFFHEVLGTTDDAPARTVPCNWADATYVNCVPASGSATDVLQLAVDNGYGFADFDTLVNAFFANGVYIDVHTEAYPSGEIRGQLFAQVPEPATFALLGVALAGLGFTRRRKPR